MSQETKPNHWYTAAEAAPFLGVKEQTVTRYCREGRFKGQAKKRGPSRKWHVKGAGIEMLRKEFGLA